MTGKVLIHQLATGVPGLDALLGGGLPEFSFNVIAGTPGCGKTILAHQIMFGLASPERRALFFTGLGEPALKMLRYQQQFSFFDPARIGESVQFINLVDEMRAGDFNKILERIMREVETYSPALVFLDSFRSILLAPKGESERAGASQFFVQDLALRLTGWEATTFMIGEYVLAEIDTNAVFAVADGIIWLSRNLHRDSRVRKIEVKKMRGQAPLPGPHTYRISKDGVQAFPRAIIGAAITRPPMMSPAPPNVNPPV